MVIMDEQYNGIQLDLGGPPNSHGNHYVLRNGTIHQSGAFQNSTNNLINGIQNVGHSITNGIQKVPNEIHLLRDRVSNKDYFLMTEQIEMEEHKRDRLIHSPTTKSISSKQLLKRPLGIKDNDTGLEETFNDHNSKHRFRSWSSPSVPVPKTEASVQSSVETKNVKALTLPRAGTRSSTNPHHFTLLKKHSYNLDKENEGIMEVDEEERAQEILDDYYSSAVEMDEDEGEEEEEEEELTRIRSMSLGSNDQGSASLSSSSIAVEKYKKMQVTLDELKECQEIIDIVNNNNNNNNKNSNNRIKPINTNNNNNNNEKSIISNSGILVLERTNSTNSLDCMADTEYPTTTPTPNICYTTNRQLNTPSPRNMSCGSPTHSTTTASSLPSSPRSTSLLSITFSKPTNSAISNISIVKAKPTPPPRSPASLLKHSTGSSLAVPTITTTSASSSPNGAGSTTTTISPSPSPLSLSSNNSINNNNGRSLTPTMMQQHQPHPSRNQLSMSSPKIIINKHLVRCDSNGSISSSTSKSNEQSQSQSQSSSPNLSPKKATKTIALSKSKSSSNVPTNTQKSSNSGSGSGQHSPLAPQSLSSSGTNIAFQNELKLHLKAKEERRSSISK
ncbi:hypothetical protein DFA_01662 [Cavenderia fasciculata]|uniref:Uncharacterized protein n=1 Tax=Cavenderia fasciculata TaxID=261658 RepID=F4PU08_CACFS|nr:uncharacterized protein DFA_01662 [Cavenderia fasciculata]EGG21776.1 hypothetical protein DFA_01662 [Cavenderia fasciculata]|eukprot:XP_004359626.1 hypothetical protein DFA_01662 [Cavenderia fasciculata]